MDGMFRLLMALLILAPLTSCQQGSSSGAGVAVVDIYLVMRYSDEVKKAKEETPKLMAKLKEVEVQLKTLDDEIRSTLESIPDKSSLAYKDKEEAFMRRRREITSKAVTGSLNALTAEAGAYDRAYRQVMDTALKVAKRHGASTVLPLRDLPNPSLEVDRDQPNPHGAMREYLMDMFQRPVVASSHEADITTEVLEELGWAR